MRIFIIKMLNRAERTKPKCGLMTQETAGVGQKGNILVIEYLIVLTIMLVLLALIVRN